ncbi:hypothetical protein EC9_27470 [Rosistilla ulvae]|uniref:Zinc finger/thioredoxin putative domain-containing protein n=1 Tax=Rosistilla ulvae TaxID=1930277 RepID=A0A517M124_9BACT|nr:hypothetical protein [Rosistilla ulvae]QDS88556.1 hypothetical protein EC9_27470 [Rosistilla ulvae]
MSVLQIRCPGCQAVLRIPATAAGSKVRCSQCKKILAIPARSPASESKKSSGQNPAASAAPAPHVGDDPFGGLDDFNAGAPFSAAAPYSPPPTNNPSAPSFQPTQTKQAGGDASAAIATKPKWLIPGLVCGALVLVGMVGATVLGYFAFTRSVDVAVAEQRAAQSSAKAAAAASLKGQMEAMALDNPLPSTWTPQGATGATVNMPADAIVREVASPVQGQLVFRVAGTDPDSGATFWLTEMPIAPGSEIRRDMWLRNLYRYSGGQAEELAEITRSGVAGKRIVLARDGEQKDPLLEVFMMPDRMVVTSVQPGKAKLGEAFFASLTLSDSGDSGGESTPGSAAVASTDQPSASMPKTTRPTGDEARRQKIYLEYRRYAGANTTRSPLPGINARDAVDRLLGQVNESQTQAFLVLHNLTEQQLGEIITEGNNKNWGAR